MKRFLLIWLVIFIILAATALVVCGFEAWAKPILIMNFGPVGAVVGLIGLMSLGSAIAISTTTKTKGDGP